MTTVDLTRGAVTDDALLVPRHVIVEPSMCSGGSSFFATIGDWTWDAVGADCRMSVHTARTPDGDPAYLSFCYFRVHSGSTVHPHGLTFGDELQVTCRVFQLGTGSVVTLHRLAPMGVQLGTEPLDPVEAYEQRHPDCLYIETFNRWIARTSAGSNRSLAQVCPAEFSYADLPRLPNAYSPRTVVGKARAAGSFHPEGRPGYTEAGQPFTVEYALDVVRDLNGAGLMYFASYFAIFDTALLRLWHSLGRTDEQFLRRKLVSQEIGYFGNADPGAVFAITVRRWLSPAQPGVEVAEMAMRETVTGRLVAVTSVEIETVEIETVEVETVEIETDL